MTKGEIASDIRYLRREARDAPTGAKYGTVARVAVRVIDALNAELSAHGWTSTADHLPDPVDGAFILVALNYDPDEAYPDRFRMLEYVASADNPGWYTGHGNRMSLTTLRVSHWMPITAPKRSDEATP